MSLKQYLIRNPFLWAAAGDRLVRTVSGVPGLITDGEYDRAAIANTALDASGLALIASVKKAVSIAAEQSAGQFRRDEKAGELKSLGGHSVLFRTLNLGMAALGVIDLANGAGTPDEGGDFLTAADLLDGVGAGVAAAGPDAGRWAGMAAQGYSDRTRAVMSDLDTLQQLDVQMQTLMARQADAVQKAHLTVAGGMSTLVMCYPIAMSIFVKGTHAASVAFQRAAVSAVLGGVATMEYLTGDESARVGKEVDAVAEQYRALFQAGRRSAGGAAVEASPTPSGGVGSAGAGSPSGLGSSAMPTVAQLAARAGDGRAEQLHSVLNLPTSGRTPDVDPDTDSDPGTGVSSPAAPLPANPAPPTGAGTPAPRAAQPHAPQGRAGSAAAAPAEPQATVGTSDEAAPHGAPAAAVAGVQRAGTAPLDRTAGQPQPGGEPVAAPQAG